MMSEKSNHTTIILFDGVCNFCNSSINFIIKHDKKNRFKFAAIQSKTGQTIIKKYFTDKQFIDSIIVIDNNKTYFKSSAILKIVLHLNGLYPLLYSLVVIPPIIRNGVYDIIAKNRYKWFGKKEECMIPTEEIRSKFILEEPV